MAVTELESLALWSAVAGIVASVAVPSVAGLIHMAREAKIQRALKAPIDWSPDWNLEEGDEPFEETLSAERARRHYYARRAVQ